MTELQRVRKVLQWLSLCGFGDDDNTLRLNLGYKNKSSFSQIINGIVPLNDLFIKKLQILDPNINKVWIREEKGAMLSSIKTLNGFQLLEVAKDEYYERMCEMKDKEIERLTELNKQMINEWGITVRKQWGRQEEENKTG